MYKFIYVDCLSKLKQIISNYKNKNRTYALPRLINLIEVNLKIFF